MMYNSDFKVDLDKVRREEMMRNAEKARQEKQVGREEPRPAFYGPLLAQMGRTMANVGNNLQDRYGKVSETAAVSPKNYVPSI